jgi:transcriptional regulator with XRE-family HTH domain
MPVQSPDFRRTVAKQMEDYRQRMALQIKRERLRHGQRPQDIAYKINVDKRTYERWEEGEVSPQPPNLKALADEWGVDIEILRPDLQREAEMLSRIEVKIDRLLKHLELPIEVDLSESPEQVLAEIEQLENEQAESKGIANGQVGDG